MYSYLTTLIILDKIDPMIFKHSTMEKFQHHNQHLGCLIVILSINLWYI